MEKTIQKLVEFDSAGHRIVEEAQEQSRSALMHLDEEKQQMYRENLARAEEHVARYREEAKAEQQAQTAMLQKEFGVRADRLKQTFDQNTARWVKEIVARCQGREI